MHRITRVGVLSLGKLMGVTGAVMGLLLGLIYGGVFAVAGLVSAGAGAKGSGPPGLVMAAMGVGFVIAFPIIYGLMMFVFGLIYALVLNLMFGVVGGLELEIQAPDSLEGIPKL